MKYKDAKKLHNEDEVTVKKTKRILTVITVEVHEKDVFIQCSDGCLYHHTDVR